MALTPPLNNENPTGTAPYTIVQGDTLGGLAQKHGTTVEALMAANSQITDPNKIYAGYKLNLPGAVTPPVVTPAPAATPPNATGANPYGYGADGKPLPNPNPSGTPGNPTPTAGELYGGIYAPSKDEAAIKAASDAATNGYNAGAPDETDIFNKSLNQYKDQLDAIERLYSSRRSDVTKQYTDIENARLGSNRALLANTGMAGNSYGQARTDVLNTANANELGAAQEKVDAEKAAAIASIMGQVRTQASTEYQNKLTAYSSGADKAVSYLKDAAARRDTNITSIAQNALLKKLDLTDPNNAGVVKSIADNLGIDPSVIIDKFRAVKLAYDQTQVKTKQENDKAAADLAKTIAETSKIPSDIAKTKAETAKVYADMAKVKADTANGGTYQSGGLKIGKADLSDIQNVLEKGNKDLGLGGKGQDGYANSETYIKLYNHWVNPPEGKGGLAKDFISIFPPKTYLNPNDPSLPDQLKEAITNSNITVNAVIPGVGG